MLGLQGTNAAARRSLPERLWREGTTKPSLNETEIGSEKLDGDWHGGCRGEAALIYDNEQTVVHSEESSLMRGVHINQVECL
jgi:hypothetical protein